jgi:hypothetical protein
MAVGVMCRCDYSIKANKNNSVRHQPTSGAPDVLLRRGKPPQAISILAERP